MNYSRRQILRAFALGGSFVVAGELWIPGQKLISIPKPQLKYKATEHLIEWSVQQMVDEAFDIEYKRYHDLWIACSQEGGAMLSKDGIEWERIKPSELYVTDEALEESRA